MSVLRFLGLTTVLGLACAGCAGPAEGVRVGTPESSMAARGGRAPLKGKIVAEAADEGPAERVDVAAFASTFPFPVEPPDPHASAAEVDHLQKAGGSVKSNWVPPGQADRWGHAAVLIHAPLDTVRVQVTDFAHLRDLAPQKFRTSRIVDKVGSLTDVYLQIPVLRGLVVLWQVVRFAPVQPVAPGMEVVQGALVRGNVKQLRIVLTMRSVDPQTTVLACDLLLVPEFFAPQGAMDEELRDAAQNAVDSVKERAERAARS